MAHFRLSRLAEADLAHIVAVSEERWGADGMRRYAALLVAAMRKVAADPKGPATRDRPELSPGMRSFHIRHARGEELEARVRHPVHVLYFRMVDPNLIEITRVLHERMEPTRHVGTRSKD
jgi:toxin ParE1/3/4